MERHLLRSRADEGAVTPSGFFYNYWQDFNQIYVGLTPHEIFVDSHFEEYHRIIALRYVPQVPPPVWLPVIDAKGLVREYNTGNRWTYYTFRAMGPRAQPEELDKALIRFTAFWARHHTKDLHDARFDILSKEIEIPKNWQKNFLKSQQRIKWKVIGRVTWKQEEPQVHYFSP